MDGRLRYDEITQPAIGNLKLTENRPKVAVCGYNVMIPEFNEDGYLPPGVHAATMDEIAERFGASNEIRRAQIQSLVWLVDTARRGNAIGLCINGSFVTDVEEPNDIDCVLLIPQDVSDATVLHELQQGFPFLSLEVVTEVDEFAYFTQRFFASDRESVVKGMIEVIL